MPVAAKTPGPRWTHRANDVLFENNLVAVADYYAISNPDLRFELLLDLFVQVLAERSARGDGT